MRSRLSAAYLIALFAVPAAFLWAHGKPITDWAGARPVDAALPADVTAALPALVGEWYGGWVDTVYTVAGDMSFSIHQDGNAYFATGTIDVGGINAGLGVLSGSASGSSSGNTLTGNFTCTSLGNGNFTITAPAAAVAGVPATAVGGGTVGAPLSFGAFVFSGFVIDGIMAGTFDFTSPTGGKGFATMSKVDAVEAKTWGEVKATYGR